MSKYRIIGNMTGNSMDAIDLVLTEFDGNNMQDICTFTKPYDKSMQDKIEWLRAQVFNKTKAEIENISTFKQIHDEYVTQIADCINQMLAQNNIDKSSVDAIGFHGKTLDHNPPSKASGDNSLPYTLQMGSGQMLANLTGIKVVYDFRSPYIMNGFEGAPLVAPHNAHISSIIGDGCYYNGGNTSNFAFISNGKSTLSADAGPFNEYTDNYVRLHTDLPFDKDGQIGLKGKLNPELFQKMFDLGRNFYQSQLPRSGDPAYYHKDKIFNLAQRQNISFEDIIHTFEFFAAYIAVHALCIVPDSIKVPTKFILFGGGWKNPVVKQSFENLLKGKSYILPEHQADFAHLKKRFSAVPVVIVSPFGAYMEARLFADMARYKLENKVWELPEIIQSGQKIVSGLICVPDSQIKQYSDMVNLAAKGWR